MNHISNPYFNLAANLLISMVFLIFFLNFKTLSSFKLNCRRFWDTNLGSTFLINLSRNHL
ncbi:hypothetical protein HanIR_Chr11g0547921 [Helianthus annuus]|nr:hypothetical protein HanIR_Chr11g0547921 [Helianthus annuus]